MAPTTDLELRQFLSSRDIPCHEAMLLPGGSANYVWRITTLLGRCSVIKHAEEHVRSAPDFALDAVRLKFEHAALETVAEVMPMDKHIGTPRVLHYWPDEHTLHLSDAGARDLKECYGTEEIDLAEAGAKLGAWLAELHNSTSQTHMLEELKAKFDGDVARTLFGYPYQGLIPVFQKHDFDVSLAKRINEQYGVENESDQVCLCHGDFWPQNVLLTQKEPLILTIIDWEGARVGSGATDAARFAAQSWLLDRFKGDRGLFQAFLSAYISKRAVMAREQVRFVVQFAVHIIFYSQMRWADQEGTKKMVQIGVDLLEAVDKQDEGFLKNGILQPLFG